MKNNNEISSDTGGLTAKKISDKPGINWTDLIGNTYFVLAWLWIAMLMAYFTMRLFFS